MQGAESSFSIDMETQVYRVPVWEKISQQLSSAGYAFLAARGIGKAVANANDVCSLQLTPGAGADDEVEVCFLQSCLIEGF